MKAIVTGADGFVGSYVVKELLRNNYQVLAIDLPNKPRRLVDQENLTYIASSVHALRNLGIGKNQFDVFFHFAWRGSAGLERCDEIIQLQNAIETAECVRFAGEMGIKRFIMSGTIMEFETNEVVYEQGSKPGLPYIYGAGKCIAHQIAKPIANSVGVDLVWAYITNAYGPGETSPRLLNSIIRNVIDGKQLKFTSGVQNYDFVFVTDVAKAFRLLGERGRANKGYLIGSGEAKPLKEWITEAVDLLKPSEPPVFGDIPYTGVMTPVSYFSIQEISTDCGFKPSVPFKEGLKATFEWRKRQQE